MFYSAGLDFQPTVEVLNFLPGMGRQCACIEILQDTEGEDDEMFSAILSTTSLNVMITRNTATITILDDDSKMIIHTQISSYIDATMIPTLVSGHV